MENERFDLTWQKLQGTACYAPYIWMTISSLTDREIENDCGFWARIDTGADITCVPVEIGKKLMPLLLGRPVLVRGHNGKVVRAKTHLCTTTIYSEDRILTKSRRLERGVLLTDSNIGLLGQDFRNENWKTVIHGKDSYLTNRPSTADIDKRKGG